MASTQAIRAPRRRTRPFLPVVPWSRPPALESRRDRLVLVLAVCAAYGIGYGRGIWLAIRAFVIRQHGTLHVEPLTSQQYLVKLFIYAVLTCALSVGVVVIYRRWAHWPWADLGVTRPPHGKDERRLWWRTSMVYLFAIVAGFIAKGLLAFLPGDGGYPEPTGAHLGRAIGSLPEALSAGIGEELVVVAFLVVALERLGARTITIYAIAIAARLAYHVYYGPDVIGLALWAGLAVWLFRRTRLILPSMIVHTLWDTNAFLGSLSGWTAIVAVFGFLTALGCLVVTGIVHLATRREPLPVAGWYDNPDGGPNARYWDGRHWTAMTWSPPPAPR